MNEKIINLIFLGILMESILVQRCKQYALTTIDTYKGSLGHQFLRAMLFALEKQAIEECEKNPKLHKNALLIGVYFHELGRVKSEKEDHTKHSVALFDDFVKDMTVSDQTREIVHDCCYNHLVDGIPYTKEGTFVKNWHWAISFAPEALLARLEDLQLEGHSFMESKKILFDQLEKDYRSIEDDVMREHARNTLQNLRVALKN
jgi:hypothetical protein